MEYSIEVVIKDVGTYWIKCGDKNDYGNAIRYLENGLQTNATFTNLEQEKTAIVRTENILAIKEHIVEKKEPIKAEIEPLKDRVGNLINQEGGKLIY